MEEPKMTAATENPSNEDGNKPSGETSAAGDEFKPITSQEDLNRVIAERVKREQAKFSDYKDLKAKADRLTEIEDAQKSEADKAAERIRTLEADAAEARREALRFKVASKFGISDEDADLFLTGSDEESLTKQAERLAARTADRVNGGNVVPREGSNPNPGEGNSDGQFARQLFSPS